MGRKGASNWGPDEHKPDINIDKEEDVSPIDCRACGGTGKQARVRHDNSKKGQGNEYRDCPTCDGRGYHT